ncbi:MAG: oligosaccharide flippase family protein [Brotaphodocola sp.]
MKQFLSPQKRAFLTGTLLLTGTGFLCRVLGFFYRIFLSRTIGAEGLGLYNMAHPVYGICFALCAGSIQTALSQLIASQTDRGKSIFRTGLLISMTMAFVLAALICQNAQFLAACIIMEPRCAPYLPLMGISVPFAAFHACINGYYYGMQKSKIPAFSQVAEQVVRMTLVFFIADLWVQQNREITVELAIIGHLIGEIAAAVFTFFCLILIPPQPKEKRAGLHFADEFTQTAVPLLSLALPLMGNRLVLNLLSSAEAIWIPNCLQMSGLDNSEAVSVYGVLTGMALPFILFPSAITNSMAVLLLPSVAQAQAAGHKKQIMTSISISLRYSMYMGIFCIGIFTMFGKALGTSVFHNADAGNYIQILAWLCPFLYLATTMGSILNGLGNTRITFLQNTSALILRIGFVLIGIPQFGIYAYLCGMLASEIFLAFLHLWSLRHRVPFSWNAWEMIVKPVIFLWISTGILHFANYFMPWPATLSVFIQTALQIGFLGMCYGGLLLLFHLRK